MAAAKDGAVAPMEFTRDELVTISLALRTQSAVIRRAAKAETDSEIRAMKERNAVKLDALYAKVNNLSFL